MEDPFLHLASLSSYIAQQFAQFIGKFSKEFILCMHKIIQPLNIYCFIFYVYGFRCDKGFCSCDSIAEDLICIDIFGWSENLVGFGGQHVTFTSNRGYRSVHEASSFSSRVSNQGSSLIIRERSTSNPNDSLPVHSRLEIVRSNQSYGGFSLIFEG